MQAMLCWAAQQSHGIAFQYRVKGLEGKGVSCSLKRGESDVAPDTSEHKRWADGGVERAHSIHNAIRRRHFRSHRRVDQWEHLMFLR